MRHGVTQKPFDIVMIAGKRFSYAANMGSAKDMTRTELDRFHTMLTTKQTELVRTLERRDGIAIVRMADALDELQLAAERELTTRRLEYRSQDLQKVRAALDRVADGSYGTCFDCEDEISQKRLQAVPWATLCLACQEAADRHARVIDRFLQDAA